MDATWRAMANEAALAAEHICIGVTALGRANYAERAYYPEAFFALSVGLERSSKLALVLDHAIRHEGAFPDEQVYRGFGHRIQELMEAMDEIAERWSEDESITRPDTEIHRAMLDLLTDFANNVTRYYNLDVLVGKDAAEDPITAWDRQVTQAVLAKHDTERSRRRREENARQVGAMMEGISIVRHEAESGEELTSAQAASLKTGETEFARPWERLYLLQLGRFFYSLMSQLTHAGRSALTVEIPHLDEFYALFFNDDAYLRSRKTWSIYKP